MHKPPIFLKTDENASFAIQMGGIIHSSQDKEAIAQYLPIVQKFGRFAVGEFYWFIANTVNGVTIKAGGNLTRLCSFSAEDFVGHTPELLFRSIHPEDLPQMVTFTNYWIKLISEMPPLEVPMLSSSIYIRLMNASSQYYWANVQIADSIFDANGKIVYGLTFVTDVSHLKKDGTAFMSILDRRNEACQHFYCTPKFQLESTQQIMPKISAREIDILHLLAAGHSSKQIAGELNIAIKTVDNHRQNLLRKTNARSTAELVTMAVKLGLV
jgi:DNA-binding CsgD family transcriptional regulator